MRSWFRRPPFISCLVVAAAGWMLAAGTAPAWIHAEAGGQETPAPLPGQWRILPRPPFARPADEEITARLARQIDAVVALFQTNGRDGTLESLGDSLIDGKARNQLFRLESLLRLYSRAFPDFETYRRDVKEIEDGLGAYAYALDSLNFAKAKAATENETQPPDARRQAEQQRAVDALARKQVTARRVLAKLLDDSPLVANLTELRSVLRSTLVGWGPSKDLAYIDRELERALRHVKDGRFNFNLMEDGIHEFRRQLRWFPMYIDSLDGLILVRDDPPGACPVPALQALAGSSAAGHRYANPALRFPASRPCTISRCLLWQVSKTVRDLGHLKDEAQGNAAVEAALADQDVDVATSNHATPDEIARAKAIRTELYSSRALDHLMSQLSSCGS